MPKGHPPYLWETKTLANHPLLHFLNTGSSLEQKHTFIISVSQLGWLVLMDVESLAPLDSKESKMKGTWGAGAVPTACLKDQNPFD